MKDQKHTAANPTPRGVHVDRFGPDLIITRSWRSLRAWNSALLLAFLTVFLGILSLGVGNGIRDQLGSTGALILVIPFAVGWLCAAYALASRLVNRTRICLSHGRIDVRHRPLPWWGNREYGTAIVRQLFCVETKHVQKNRPYFTYSLILWKLDDSHEVLVSGIDDEEQALFIERQIEEHLNLTKESVPGGYQVRA